MIAKTLAQIAADQAAISWMICLGLLIFVTFFACMLAWTTRRGSAPFYQAMSQMPLENESPKYVGSRVEP